MKSEYLNVPQAAEHINRKVRFIRRLVAERRIAFYKVGTHILIAVEDLDNYMQANRVEPITPTSVARDLKEVA